MVAASLAREQKGPEAITLQLDRSGLVLEISSTSTKTTKRRLFSY